jgi:hypothetical protein
MKCPKCQSELKLRVVYHHDCWGRWEDSSTCCECVCGVRFFMDGDLTDEVS